MSWAKVLEATERPKPGCPVNSQACVICSGFAVAADSTPTAGS